MKKTIIFLFLMFFLNSGYANEIIKLVRHFKVENTFSGSFSANKPLLYDNHVISLVLSYKKKQNRTTSFVGANALYQLGVNKHEGFKNESSYFLKNSFRYIVYSKSFEGFIFKTNKLK